MAKKESGSSVECPLKIPTNFLWQFQQIPDDWNFENYCKNYQLNDKQIEEIKKFCKKWLEDYAEELGDNSGELEFYEGEVEHCGHTYESLMKGLKEYSEGEIWDLHFRSNGMVYTSGWTNNANPFAWVCYEIVTGEKVKEKDNFFRCSC